ncbi:MAG: DUF11 domain-containing protein [Burkholderiaceae bacterium]|jgi:uncharacterized repeat protein (TIGR01451 family)|nr:DUF11 domain-containing protein [Burkholderiaceae bacterium]
MFASRFATGCRSRTPGNLKFRRSALSLAVLSTALLAAPAFAQTAQQPTQVWNETFSEVTTPSKLILVKTGGLTFTSDDAYRPLSKACDGWIINSDTALTSSVTDTGCESVGWARMQSLAGLLGGNAAIAYTNAGSSSSISYAANVVTISDLSQATNLAEPVIPGHFYMGSVKYAALDCTSSAPMIAVNLLGGNSTSTAPVSVCTGTPQENANSKDGSAYVSTVESDVLLYTGAPLQYSISNSQTSGNGNDSAFNNLTLWDVTPTVTQAVSTPTATVNTPVTLTFTVTNTTDDLTKDGWSFTDELPSGLTVVPGATPGGTCLTAPYKATVDASGSSIAVEPGSGDIPGGSDNSCTISVQVTSAAPGTYVSGVTTDPTTGSTADTITPTGLISLDAKDLIFTAGDPPPPPPGGNPPSRGGVSSVPMSKGALGLLALLLAAAAYPLSRRAKKRS